MLKKYWNDFKITTLIILPFFIIVTLIVSIILSLRYTVFAPKLNIEYTKVRSPTVVSFNNIEVKDIADYALYSPTANFRTFLKLAEASQNLRSCKVGKYKLEGQDLLSDTATIRKLLEPMPRYDNNGDPIYSTYIYQIIGTECYCNILYNSKGVFLEIGDEN